MTRPTVSALVLDGSQIKARIEAERVHAGTPVHVDWVRFTALRRNSPAPAIDTLFPRAGASIWDENFRAAQIATVLQGLPDSDFSASAQAYDLALECAVALGPEFSVAPDIRKGHDFYKFRWAIQRNAEECGWVGYLSSSDSPRQQAQSRTVHANIWGSACTFAAPGWNLRIAAVVEARDADLTRCDLALDFFEGLAGGIEGIVDQYRSGVCDVGGRRLNTNCVGDWINGKERSLYFGSKEAGKQTNTYEKGHQLFGAESGSQWLRIELRYGNKLRALSADMLRQPADFFAGASAWHALMLIQSDAVANPEKVLTEGRLAIETVAAEVTRAIRWCDQTAGQHMAVMFRFGGDRFLDMVTNRNLPGRLKKFTETEIQTGLETVLNQFSTVDSACHASQIQEIRTTSILINRPTSLAEIGVVKFGKDTS